MSSLRLTKTINDAILANAAKLFEKRIQTAEQNIAPDFYDRCANNYYEKEIHPWLINFNPAWITTIRYVTCSFESLDVDNNLKSKTRYVNRLNQPYQVPKLDGVISGDNMRIPEDYQHPIELDEEFQAYQRGIIKVEVEKKTLTEELTLLLKNCTTVKQFLTHWGPGEELLPEATLAQHRGTIARPIVTTRNKKPAPEIKNLNAALLRTKLLNNI